MLTLTRESLRASYDFLRTTAPFNEWNLPDGEDIAFRVVRSRRCLGWYDLIKGKHTIGISERCVAYTVTLITVMAHEMIHLHERAAGFASPTAQHTAAFHKIAENVCAIHGFDPKAFA